MGSVLSEFLLSFDIVLGAVYTIGVEISRTLVLLVVMLFGRIGHIARVAFVVLLVIVASVVLSAITHTWGHGIVSTTTSVLFGTLLNENAVYSAIDYPAQKLLEAVRQPLNLTSSDDYGQAGVMCWYSPAPDVPGVHLCHVADRPHLSPDGCALYVNGMVVVTGDGLVGVKLASMVDDLVASNNTVVATPVCRGIANEAPVSITVLAKKILDASPIEVSEVGTLLANCAPRLVYKISGTFGKYTPKTYYTLMWQLIISRYEPRNSYPDTESIVSASDLVWHVSMLSDLYCPEPLRGPRITAM